MLVSAQAEEGSALPRIVLVLLFSLASVLLSPSGSAEDPPSFADISFEVPVLAEGVLAVPFGLREDPFTNRPSWHGGIDINAAWDAPIRAPATGKVVHAGQKSGYGQMIDLKVSDNWVLRFAHLSALSVELGDEIAAGDVLGQIGSTGRATGPHLHLEALHGDKQYDPVLFTELELYETELARD